MAEPTDKLVADIDYKLSQEFEKRVYSVPDRTKREVVEKAIRDWMTNDEGNPRGFPKKADPVIVRRRTKQ